MIYKKDLPTTKIANYKSMIKTTEKVKPSGIFVGDNIDIIIDINNRLDIPTTMGYQNI